MKTIPKEYFVNRSQQAEIKLNLTEAIPEGVYYHNLIIALTEMLQRTVEAAYKEEVYTKKVKR